MSIGISDPSTVTVEQTSTVETEAQSLHRLAGQAKERGIKIIVNQVTNHHFATSSSNRDKLHAITLLSCDCRGFITWGRCMHHSLLLEMYHSLPPLDPAPDGGGVTLTVPAPLPDTCPEGSDILISIVPAPRRSASPRVENPRTAYAGTRADGSTYLIRHADAVVIDGIPHRVGDAVLVTDKRWGWTSARITCIRTVGSTGKVWKVDVDGTGYGETTRSLSEVRAVAVSSEEVRHAA